MDRDERARLRALCEAATPGPWETYRPAAGGLGIAHGDPRTQHGCIARIVAGSPADAALMGIARAALPALLDDSERLATVERERDEARAEVERLRARLHRCAQCGADDSAVAACEGDEYPLCGPCATHALREARADAAAALAHTDREVGEILRTLPEALRLAAEDEREACAELAEKWLREVSAITQDTPADLADAIRARGTGGAT